MSWREKSSLFEYLPFLPKWENNPIPVRTEWDREKRPPASQVSAKSPGIPSQAGAPKQRLRHGQTCPEVVKRCQLSLCQVLRLSSVQAHGATLGPAGSLLYADISRVGGSSGFLFTHSSPRSLSSHLPHDLEPSFPRSLEPSTLPSTA